MNEPQTIVLQRIIPNGVQAEYEAAVQRTGLTPQLERALPVLTRLFSFSPQELQEAFDEESENFYS